MKINAVTHGALRILMICGDGEAVTLPEMASRLGMPEARVIRSCSALARAGLLVSRRGRGGGYRLGRPAADISVLAVIDLFEPENDMRVCGRADTNACQNCPLAGVCADAYRAMRDELASISVADILISHGRAHTVETS
ncbi:Rrf2 family transcriptional regulator [Pleomorphomonas oryzae]|uniref:Rrf2 family transcriptional regulator n=1 Tax=Pleomorphomonas oryzae TaxID=261934 RepID=UPI0004227414|nr:Rrf2 family transcriptional regulator [Pleomorphomonas oryzae]